MERAGKIHKPKTASEHSKDAGSKHAPVASPLMTQAPPSPRWDFSRIPIFPPEPQMLPVGPLDDPLEHEADLVRTVEDTGRRMPPLKPAAAPDADTAAAPQIVHQALQTPGQPLDPSTRARMDRSFDYNFGAVRLHSDSLAARAAQSLNAAAFTVGEDIVFAPGRLAPETETGQWLIAHELAHVVQQSRGSSSTVSPETGSRFERHATDAAHLALAGQPVPAAPSGAVPIVQYETEEELRAQLAAVQDQINAERVRINDVKEVAPEFPTWEIGPSGTLEPKHWYAIRASETKDYFNLLERRDMLQLRLNFPNHQFLEQVSIDRVVTRNGQVFNIPKRIADWALIKDDEVILGDKKTPSAILSGIKGGVPRNRPVTPADLQGSFRTTKGRFTRSGNEQSRTKFGDQVMKERYAIMRATALGGDIIVSGKAADGSTVERKVPPSGLRVSRLNPYGQLPDKLMDEPGEGSIEPPDQTRPDIPLPRVASGATKGSGGNVPQPAQSKANAKIILAKTSVDARARARAAEFSPLFFEWQNLHPVERQDRIQQLINAYLVSEGVPPVWVNAAADVEEGNAEFRINKWNIHISEKTLNKPTLTLDEFAGLADNATHEARHAVHHFRGLRIALSKRMHAEDAKIPQTIVAAARDANKRAGPRSQLSAEAYGEAWEIYEVTHLETPRREAMQATAKARGEELDTTRDVVNRSEIIQRYRIAADTERSAAQKVRALRAVGKKGTQEYLDALSDHAIALREAVNAHNEYTALPQETDAWRYGSAVRKAVKERLQIQLRVNGAEISRAQAKERARDALAAGDEAKALKADVDYLAADNRARAARAELDALVPTQPRQLHGRTLTHEVAADPATGVPPRRTSRGSQPLPEGRTQVSPDDIGQGEEGSEMSARPPRGSLTSAAKGRASDGRTPPGVPPKAPPPASPRAPIKSKQPPVEGSAPKVATGGADKPAGKAVAEGVTEPTGERHGGVVSGQGDLIGAEKRKVASGQRGGTPVTTTTAAKVAVRPDGTIAATTEATQETVIGTDSYGRPITQTRSAQAGLAISEKGATAHGSISQQTAGGGRHSVGASGTIDASGNVSGQLSYSYLTKQGVSFTPSVSASYEVQASDPIKLDNGKFAVTFAATSTKGAGFGASKQFGRGPSVGVDVGTTEGTMDTGTKIFDDENKAKEFKTDAAMYIEKERLGEQKPLSSVAGALAIPEGETRGSGQLSGQSIGGSVAFEGATFSVGHHTTDIQQFEVTHVSQNIFQAKGTMTGSKGNDVSLGGGLALNRGGSTTRSFAVTWEFNLTTPGGQAAFEQYAKTLIPPFGGAKLVATEALDSEEDHDQVTIPLLGTAKWTGSTWEITRVDERGTHQQFGGEQSHDQDPSFIGRHVFGQDEIHSKAQIVSKLENGKEAGFEAQMTVKGDSGEATREAFGEIFMGVRHEGTATASGEWSLSATIDPKVVHELERNSKEFREAMTNEEKLRIYSKFVKENGAKMLGGQVRSGGDQLAWNLELKGDKNFPGTAGRDELERKRADLKERLRTHPENAPTVVTDAQATLKELHARRDAVADKTKYTDLPGELRDEQVKLIDKHIADFEFISHKASREAIKAAPGERIETTRTRLTEKGGYTDTQASADAIELVKLRDKIAEKEGQINEIDPKILEAIEAVQKAQSHTRQMNPYQAALAFQYRADYNLHWNTGSNINDRQMAMAPRADELRLKLLDKHATLADQKTSAATLHALISERMTLLQLLLNEVNSSAEALKPITTKKGMAGHEKYWAGIKADNLPESTEDE
jgi:hypothetical protein